MRTHPSALLLCNLFAVVVSGFLGACGGNVGVAGPGGSGGSGGAGGSGGTVGEGGSDCPASPPADGAPCSHAESEICQYGSLCYGSGVVESQCSGGAWVNTYADGPPAVCPDTAPVEGDSCCGLEGKECAYGACGADGSATGLACVNDVWQAANAPCVACGDITCATDHLCVVHQGFGATYECQWGCGTTADCGCGATFCGEGEACLVQENMVVCECLSC